MRTISRVDLSCRLHACEVLSLQRWSHHWDPAARHGSYAQAEETVSELQACEDELFGCRSRGRLVGVIALRREAGEVLITRLFVHPAFRRKRVASELLHAAGALDGSAQRVAVAIGASNYAAARFYGRHGFAPDLGQSEPGEALFVHRVGQPWPRDPRAARRQAVAAAFAAGAAAGAAAVLLAGRRPAAA